MDKNESGCSFCEDTEKNAIQTMSPLINIDALNISIIKLYYLLQISDLESIFDAKNEVRFNK